MSDTDDLFADANEQLIIAAVDRLQAAMKNAKRLGAPLAKALCKRDQLGTLDALAAFFEESASDLESLALKGTPGRKKSF